VEVRVGEVLDAVRRQHDRHRRDERAGRRSVGGGADVEHPSAELVAHEHVAREVGRGATEIRRALDPARHLEHRRGVVHVVEVAAADPARDHLDEHLALGRDRVVDIVADEHGALAQDC
jgi:hypothetical protein